MDADNQIKTFKSFVQAYYLAQLLETIRRGLNVFYFDFKELSEFDMELSENLLDNSVETIKAAEIALQSLDLDNKNSNFKARFYNLPKSQKVSLRDVRCEHIGKLIYVEAQIKSRTNVRAMTVSSRYECPSCGNIIPVIQNEETLKEPNRCGCGRKGKFKAISEETIDFQNITLEEDISEIGDDSIPAKMKIVLKEDLTRCEKNIDIIPPRSVRIIGIVNKLSLPTKSGTQSNKFEFFIEANNFELIESSLERIVFTDEDIEKFIELSKQPDLLKKLINSVAPQLYGHEIIKEGILLFIVKGVKKESPDGTIKARDFFHILIIGDPGTGKSQFGADVCALSYKCKKAVGKGASGVGLTASAERDELIGERVLTAGTIPMCNEGHTVIDEVDKMDDEVQSHLLSCMEDGAIEINKSRVQGKLKANVGIFMIANPKHGKFEFYSPLLNQVNLSEPIITRFDLIFPVLDIKRKDDEDGKVDKILEKHIDIESLAKREIEHKFLRKYLCYVSRHMKPKLTKEAIGEIRAFCKRMTSDAAEDDPSNWNDKKNGKKQLTAVNITGRQLESPIRLAEAYAKLRMSNTVSVDDVKRAVRMVEYYLKCFAFDRETGRIDANIMNTGSSTNEIDRTNKVKIIIFNMLDATGEPVPYEEILKIAEQNGINEESVNKAIEQLSMKGDIYEPIRGRWNRF